MTATYTPTVPTDAQTATAPPKPLRGRRRTWTARTLVVAAALAAGVATAAPASAAHIQLDYGFMNCYNGGFTAIAPLVESSGWLGWQPTFYWYDANGDFYASKPGEWKDGYGGTSGMDNVTYQLPSIPYGSVLIWHQFYDYDSGESWGHWAANSAGGDPWCQT
jgi:hypothetical protein